MRTTVDGQTRMLAVLVGGKGAFEYQHRKESYFDLCRAIQPDGPVITLETQKRAADFEYTYGSRMARRYARALRRR